MLSAESFLHNGHWHWVIRCNKSKKITDEFFFLSFLAVSRRSTRFTVHPAFHLMHAKPFEEEKFMQVEREPVYLVPKEFQSPNKSEKIDSTCCCLFLALTLRLGFSTRDVLVVCGGKSCFQLVKKKSNIFVRHSMLCVYRFHYLQKKKKLCS